MGNFCYPRICWMDKTVGHRQTRKLLECINNYYNNFLLQVAEVPGRRAALLNFVLPNKEMPGGMCSPGEALAAVTMEWWSSLGHLEMLKARLDGALSSLV